MKSQYRNLHPHKAALLNMWIWGDEYSRFGGGCMDFWDAASESRKKECRELVRRIEESPDEFSGVASLHKRGTGGRRMG